MEVNAVGEKIQALVKKKKIGILEELLNGSGSDGIRKRQVLGGDFGGQQEKNVERKSQFGP